MLAEGKLSAEEAERLLDALDGRAGAAASDTVELKDRRGRKPTKLRVYVDSQEGEGSKKAKVNVSIPLSLVRTLGPVVARNLPKETREDLNRQGVDLEQILKDVDTLLNAGDGEDLVNIDAEGGDGAKVRVYLE